MGTYAFRRLKDMFEFFRTDCKYAEKRGEKLGINLSYWSEKLQTPKPSDAQEYSADSFRQRVKQAFDDWVEASQPNHEDATEAEKDEFHDAKGKLWESTSDEVLSCANDGIFAPLTPRVISISGAKPAGIHPGRFLGGGTVVSTNSTSFGAAMPSHGEFKNTTRRRNENPSNSNKTDDTLDTNFNAASSGWYL